MGELIQSINERQEARKRQIESCKEEVRKNPDDAEAHYNLGVAYLSLNDRGSALEQYEILESPDPEIAKKLFVKLRRP